MNTHQLSPVRTATTPTMSFTPLRSGLLQRKCACGNHTVAGGECAECAKKKSGLQRKLSIGASNDPLEQEADRVADQVMAAPTHSAVSGAPPRIQRYARQATKGPETAPASVDRVLASSGRPLEPALQQDMELRFGHDFSQVRVHTGGAAEQSARDVRAHAYTVGHDVVFGAGQFAPGALEGRRLLAHELTHVVQQTGAERARGGQSNEKRGLSPIPPTIQRTVERSDNPGPGPGHPLPRVPPCPLGINGPQEVNHFCAAYVPSDAASCGTFPAPNITLTATGAAAGAALTWDIVQGPNLASIVGPANSATAVIKGDAASVTKEDVIVRVSNGTCAARHAITVRKPKSMVAAQSPSSGPAFVQSLITYTVRDQFSDAMGAGICVDETITVCARTHPIAPTFGDAPTNAQGQVSDQLRVSVASGVLPASFCIKLDQVITAGGCGPVLHNRILFQPTGITLTPNSSCSVGDPCP